MKKFFALVLCVLLVCASVSVLAELDFEYKGSETVNLKSWTNASADSNGSNWHLTWSKCNLKSSLRAVVRIHCGESAASATWVYSSASANYHPYNSGYGNGAKKVEMRGRMDNRDSGTVDVEGIFYN